MPAVTLPHGSAIIKDSVSERTNRAVSRAFMLAASASARLVNLGFDNDNPTTWDKWAELSVEDQDNLTQYQVALIANMVQSWSYDFPVNEDTALDLPKEDFDQLATACATAFSGVDFGPDTDPKAPTAD